MVQGITHQLLDFLKGLVDDSTEGSDEPPSNLARWRAGRLLARAA